MSAPTNAGSPPPTAEESAVIAKLSTLDRFLPLWIGLAMVIGLLLGRMIPSLQTGLDAVRVGDTSLPIAIGLMAMMYPVLARVKYEEMGHLTGDRKMLWLSLVLNWLIGPALMFVLAWVFLADYPAFRTGLIVIGLARCIAMVLIWNDLACGNREAGALLVAINSIFQILGYALLGTFYLATLPGWLGLSTQDVAFSTWAITKAVLIFLGIPLLAGYLTRRIGVARRGRQWYDDVFAPESHLSLSGDSSSRLLSCSRCRVQQSSVPDDGRPNRTAHARLLRRHVVRVIRIGACFRIAVRPVGDGGIHRRWQQLRTRDRSQHWSLGSDVGPSADGRGRPAH